MNRLSLAEKVGNLIAREYKQMSKESGCEETVDPVAACVVLSTLVDIFAAFLTTFSHDDEELISAGLSSAKKQLKYSLASIKLHKEDERGLFDSRDKKNLRRGRSRPDC